MTLSSRNDGHILGRRGWLVIALLAALFMTGCARSGSYRSPSEVHGEWTGVFRSILVADNAVPGRTWNAAAIEIEAGPAVPLLGYKEPYRAERAFLVMTETLPLRIVDPTDLGVSNGQQIRVKGTMATGGMYAPPSVERSKDGLTYDVSPVDRRPTVLIILDRAPQLSEGRK